MSFECPQCGTPDSLAITHRLELPPDGRSDEITLQVVGCNQCNFRGAAVYEESRRGSLDSESWHHDGYYLEKSDLNRLISLIARCPAPDNDECQCPTHQLLGQTNDRGIWYLSDDIVAQRHFTMRWNGGK